jgi:PAS domain S-box-containing protein
MSNFDFDILKNNALDLADEGIALLDKDGIYLYLNRAHEFLFGYADGELVGSPWQVIYDEEESERLSGIAFPALAKNGNWRGESVGKRKDGTSINQRVSLTSLPNGGLICITHCIDEQKEIEHQLELRNRRLDNLLASISEGILLETTDRTIVALNSALGSMSGLPMPSASAIGLNSREALEVVKMQTADPELFVSVIEQRIADGVRVADELVALKNGRILSRDFIPITNNGVNESYLWVYRDVTDRERSKRELTQLVERERELNELQSRFIQTISHEFKKPILNTLRGTALLKSTLSQEQESGPLKQSLDFILEQMDALNRNINRLVSYQNLLTSRNLTLREVSARNIIANFLNYNYSMFVGSGKFEVTDSTDIAAIIRADMEMMDVVLTNLVENALRYSAFHERISISAWSDMTEGLVHWTVSNHMRAGQEPDTKLIGKNMYRANPKDDSGLGLGLSIVAHIVALHKGTVHMTAKDGVFSIEVILPIAK